MGIRKGKEEPNDKISDRMGGYIGFVEALGDAPVLTAVRRGLILMIPVVLLGSFSLLLSSFPVPAYQAAMEKLFGEDWSALFTYGYQSSMGILSILTVLFVSYTLTAEKQKKGAPSTEPVVAAGVSLCAFVALFGVEENTLSVTNLGTLGIFAAIATAMTASWMFTGLCKVNLLRIKPFPEGDSVTFGRAVSAIFPAAITISSFALLNRLLERYLHISDINTTLSDNMVSLFSMIGNPFLRAIVFVFLVHLFWFFGIHGSNVLEPVAQGVFAPAILENQHLLDSGLVPTELFSKTFFDVFVVMGGCGSTLCFVLAIFLLHKNKNQVRIARLSLVPMVFNINELMIFGFPIVLNPLYFLPFLGVPLLLTLTSSLAMILGLVPLTVNSVEWTTPVFLSGFYATGSLAGSVLQLVNLLLGSLCYMPFIRLSEKVTVSRQKKVYDRLCAEYRQAEESSQVPAFFDSRDAVGSLARALAEELREAMIKETLKLFYQPQVNYTGDVFGAEGLLRWKHPVFGYIYPPLAIALAEHHRFSDELGFYVIRQACRSMAVLEEQHISDISLSVNITAGQLKNKDFSREVYNIAGQFHADPHRLNLEITERVALESDFVVKGTLHSLVRRGISIEMDDFGMGHSSLQYLKDYNFSSVKLDGSLIRELVSNPNCRDIVSSIVYLSRSLNYHVVAEYVETEGQKEVLHQLGCDRYQGYLYSPAIELEHLVEMIKNKKNT